jgi:hypothetical protein
MTLKEKSATKPASLSLLAQVRNAPHWEKSDGLVADKQKDLSGNWQKTQV